LGKFSYPIFALLIVVIYFL